MTFKPSSRSPASTANRLPPSLFPPIDAYQTGRLVVDSRHSLYWEQSGNPNGVPIVFLHGGPGAGTAPAYRRFFDPAHYRIVLFDQRGSGRSTPNAEIRDNTTAHLVADIELLRLRLDIERWFVFGGSWGSTLALAYGEAHPDRCLGFILRGIFLFRRHEVDWFMRHMGRVFPEARRHFVGFLPREERDDLLGSYYARLVNPDPAVHCPAARVWSAYEDACSRLLPRGDTGNDDCDALALARIEAHYMVNDGFMAENALLDNLAAVRRHPAAIVQGRYDMVCPTATADELARAWPGADYTVVPDAGHSALEVGTAAALVAATEKFKKLY